MSLDKVNRVVERLGKKMEMSQTPVPGYIVGLSGTDSVVAFDVCYEAMLDAGRDIHMLGVHYVTMGGSSKFAKHTIPWMREKYPKAKISVVSLETNTDPRRWADLHELAKSGYWTVGTINATEHYLGKYSLLHTAVSVMPIRSIWKSEVMQACRELEVPKELLDSATIPDCLCGRDEFMAENIDLIDDVIRMDPNVFAHFTAAEVLKTMSYIKSTKGENAFRERVPYIP